jgi:asparaginyl-tRNA synthetase
LEGESVACGMTRIYTFGPTFRAEESDTSRHLSEFWMVEPEIAFTTFEQLMTVAEQYVQFCIQSAIDDCPEEIAFLSKTFGLTSLEVLHGYATKPFVRLSYTEAVKILQDAKYPVAWGDDLCSDYEKYLTDVVFKHPVIAYGYPAHIKAFYMKPDPSTTGKTVQSFDVLVPTVGELIGGSIREDDYFKLRSKMESLGKNL